MQPSAPDVAHPIFDLVLDHIVVHGDAERGRLSDEGQVAVEAALADLAGAERASAALTLVMLARVLEGSGERDAAEDLRALGARVLGEAFTSLEGDVRHTTTAASKACFSHFAEPKDARAPGPSLPAGKTVRGVGVQFALARALDR
ncbi:hypothetical protein L6R52_34455 [Myxococcota bacterium]|nr:hypothetical protein [Myxococcota bacterium]